MTVQTEQSGWQATSDLCPCCTAWMTSLCRNFLFLICAIGTKKSHYLRTWSRLMDKRPCLSVSTLTLVTIVLSCRM